MIKTLMSSLFAVFLFAMGAVGAWYFVQFQEQQENAEADDLGVAMTSPVSSDGGDALDDAATDVDQEPLTTPVRSRSMTAEEIFRYGEMYRNRIEEIKTKESRLRDQEARLQLVQDDIDQRKLEMEGLLKEVQSYVERSEALLANIQQQREQLKTEKEQATQELEALEAATSVPPETQAQNVSRVGTLLSGMNVEAAASVMKELANDGQMDYVLRILDSIEDRQGAKILDSIDNPTLLKEITQAYQDFRRTTKKR